MKKALIFDTSSIISLALNNLLFILEPLKKIFGGDFFITPEVKKELIERPIKIKRFELEVLMIKEKLNKKILTIPNINNGKIKKSIKEILNNFNRMFMIKNDYIKIIHEGEASCLALAKFLQDQNYRVALVIDERTTRLLCENPRNLHELMERKLHTKIFYEEPKTKFNFTILRSSELLFIAEKEDLIKLPASKKESIDALLYAVKYKGCSISRKEIEEAKKLM